MYSTDDTINWLSLSCITINSLYVYKTDILGTSSGSPPKRSDGCKTEFSKQTSEIRHDSIVGYVLEVLWFYFNKRKCPIWFPFWENSCPEFYKSLTTILLVLGSGCVQETPREKNSGKEPAWTFSVHISSFNQGKCKVLNKCRKSLNQAIFITLTNHKEVVLVYLLIGWKSGANFLSQSCNIVDAKPIQRTTLPIYDGTELKTVFTFIAFTGKETDGFSWNSLDWRWGHHYHQDHSQRVW